MTGQSQGLASDPRASQAPTAVGLVVHPSREIDEPLRALREWAETQSITIAQVPAPCEQRSVAPQADPEACELIVSIGGDGTMLAALRAASGYDLPVLGIACGSLGVLTSVPADQVSRALDRFAAGEWIARALPALAVHREDQADLFALNDLAILRAGQGQLAVAVHVDGVLYARLAGDGCIVSTPIGSSAYALAAGGPLVCGDTDAFVLTPLTIHGGFHPPLVLSADSELLLEPSVGHSGARLELDGQLEDERVTPLRIRLRPDMVRLVTFEDQEGLLEGLRRRRIIIDSPRILATDPTD